METELHQDMYFIFYPPYFTNIPFRNLPRRTSFREASAAFRGLNPVRFLMNNYHRKLLHKNAKKERNSTDLSALLEETNYWLLASWWKGGRGGLRKPQKPRKRPRTAPSAPCAIFSAAPSKPSRGLCSWKWKLDWSPQVRTQKRSLMSSDSDVNYWLFEWAILKAAKLGWSWAYIIKYVS